MNYKRNPLFRLFSSLKLTVICLLLLFILTGWGTLYQTDFGLYAAQKRFFYSWILLAFGFIPFPGGQLVMWTLAINLLVAALPRLRYGFKQLGLVMVHAGLVILLLGGFITYQFSVESSLSLEENEVKNSSSDRHLWELSVWEKPESGTREVFAIEYEDFEVGVPFTLANLPVPLTIENLERNSRPQKNPNLDVPIENRAGFNSLVAMAVDPDPTKNAPGIILSLVDTANKQKRTLLLNGMERYPTEISLGDKTYGFALRRKRHPLPLSLQLIDFVKDEHPGTTMASNYESTVRIDTGDMQRNVRIYMNNPLRYKDYTFYQSSFSVGSDGTETTVLSVVKNKGRLFPYISCIVIGFGLLYHFIVYLVRFINNRNVHQGQKA